MPHCFFCRQNATFAAENFPRRRGKMKMKMKNWPDWQLVVAWLAIAFVGTAVYSLPVARLIERFAE